MLALPEADAQIIAQALEACRAKLRAELSVNEAALAAIMRARPLPPDPPQPAEGL